jgi:PIN domain nuclease of toxin-antitoxin system
VIVADTHAWVWWAVGSRTLSTGARQALESASEIGICAISAWEVAMLVAHRRLELDRPVLTWIRQALALPRVKLLELAPERAVAATTLDPALRGEPADRMIVATALSLRASVVTKDRALRAFPGVRTIW